MNLTRTARQPNLGAPNNKIRILSVNQINQEQPLIRHHTPNIQIPKSTSSFQMIKNLNQEDKQMNIQQQRLQEQKQQQINKINKPEYSNYYKPQNRNIPKQPQIEPSKDVKAPLVPKQQYYNIQDKKHLNEIIPNKGILTETNFSIESERSQETMDTKQPEIDMFESILIEQKMCCKQCSFIIDQNAFITSCQHSFHYNCLSDIIKLQLRKGDYYLYCACQTKLSQRLIQNLGNQVNQDFHNKLIINQLAQIQRQFQPYIAKCLNCDYFCIEIENPKSRIGDNYKYICPNCTKKDNYLYQTYY